MLSEATLGAVLKAVSFSAISCFLYGIFFHRHRPQSRFKINIKLFRYLIWLLKEVFLSAIVMSKIILLRKNVRPVIKDISANMTQLAKVKYANSITLTPGTITLELGSKNLIVHSITSEHYKYLKEGKMEEEINKTQE